MSQEKQDRLLRDVERLLNAAGLQPTTVDLSTLGVGFVESTPPVVPPVKQLPVGCAPATSGDISDGGNGYHDVGGVDASASGWMRHWLIGSKVEEVRTSRGGSLGLNGPDVSSRVSPEGLASGGNGGGSGDGGLGGYIVGNGTVGGGGDSWGGGCLEDMVDMASIQDMMAMPFNLCNTPSARGQKLILTSANGHREPGTVADRAGPGPGAGQPSAGGGGNPRARAGPGPGGRHPGGGGGGGGGCSHIGGVGRRDAVASEVDSQKSAESYNDAADPRASAKPRPPPPARRPGQVPVTATLGYLMPTPVASSDPSTDLEATASTVVDDFPGHAAGPNHKWLESRARDSDELPPRAGDQKAAAGSGAAAADGGGGNVAGRAGPGLAGQLNGGGGSDPCSLAGPRPEGSGSSAGTTRSTFESRQVRDDAPGRLPAWPGPYRTWLKSRYLEEQPGDQEDAAGP